LLLVFYFQGALGFDALTAGVLLIPFALAFVALGPVSGWLSDRFGARGFATGGLLVSAASFAWFAVLPFGTSYAVLVIPMVLAGIGGGLFVAPNVASIMNSVPVARRGVASGISATLFNLGFLLSLGLAFVVLATGMPVSVLQDIFAGQPVAAGAVNIDRFMNSYHLIFEIVAIISLIGAVPSYFRGSRTAARRDEAKGLSPPGTIH
jgi:MFS family permease